MQHYIWKHKKSFADPWRWCMPESIAVINHASRKLDPFCGVACDRIGCVSFLWKETFGVRLKAQSLKPNARWLTSSYT